MQYIITHDKNQTFKSKELGITFKGTYAVVTTDVKGNALDLYIGDGKELKYKNVSVKSAGKNSGAYLNLRNKK